VTTFLLKAGSDAKARNNKEFTALDYVKVREILKGTDALQELEEASQ